MARYVLSPCLVGGETALVEVDLDVCPRPSPIVPCAYAVRYLPKREIARLDRFWLRPIDPERYPE